MKRYLLIICALLAIGLGAEAQNANRNGFFFEGAGGLVFGNRPYTNLDDYNDMYEDVNVLDNMFIIKTSRKSKTTYGFGFNLAAGYRWAVSRSFAVDLKAKCQDATYHFKETSLVDLMVGARYYTPDFGGNKSVYINLGTGGGLFTDKSKFAIPYEAGVGINLSNHFYMGLAWDGQFAFAHKFEYGRHYGIASIKLGFKI